MADLAHGHITDLHHAETGSDTVQFGCRACRCLASIYDHRGRVFRGGALLNLALTADASVSGITIKIG